MEKDILLFKAGNQHLRGACEMATWEEWTGSCLENVDGVGKLEKRGNKRLGNGERMLWKPEG